MISPRSLHEIESGAGLAVIADEAIKTADLRGLVSWLNSQASWSDFPIVLLTHQGGGPERNPDAARLGQLLGNVTLHRAPVSSDHAGEHRRLGGQRAAPPVSDARHSARPHRKRRPAADGAERRPSRCAGIASARFRCSRLPAPARPISAGGRTRQFTYQDLLEFGPSRRSRTASGRRGADASGRARTTASNTA